MAKGVTTECTIRHSFFQKKSTKRDDVRDGKENFGMDIPIVVINCSCVALKNLKIIKNENLIDNVNIVGKQMPRF